MEKTKVLIKIFLGSRIVQVISETEGCGYVRINESNTDMLQKMNANGECTIDEFNGLFSEYDDSIEEEIIRLNLMDY